MLRTKVQLLISVILLSINSYSAENKYPAGAIPDSLLEKANAVVRNDCMEVEYLSNSQFKQKMVYAITILNKSADNHAVLNFGYDKLRKINSLKAFVYNAEGKMIKKLKMSDFDDYSSFDGYSLFSDDRQKYYKAVISNYPYTVEFEIEYTISNLLFPVNWYFLSGYDKSVQYSSLRIFVPKGLNTKFILHQVDSALITENEKGKSYFWEKQNLKAIESEPYSLPFTSFTPWIKFAVVDFTLESYPGTTKSWEDFSNFFYRLATLENKLSDKTKNDIKLLTEKETNQTAKIKAIYEYMQSKTRYVSIQLGIGGYKPFDASVVDNLGYGDCKALVNYTKALLNEAGINSIYTLVRAGSGAEAIDTAFVYSQFNHVILCVPNNADTIWLECTSQKIPFNYLGDFTGNRYALLVLPPKGKLVYTQNYIAEKNLQSRNAYIAVNDTGSIANICTKYYGMQFTNRFNVSLSNNEDQKHWLYENTSIPNFNLLNFSYTCKKDPEPELSENLKIKLNNYTTQSGKRVFLPLNILNKSASIPPTSKPRMRDFYISYPYVDCDTIVYEIPRGFSPESLPEAKVIKSVFGEYSAQVSFNNNKVSYIRRYKNNTGRHSKELYGEFVAFKKQINLADNIKIALIKTE